MYLEESADDEYTIIMSLFDPKIIVYRQTKTDGMLVEEWKFGSQ